MKATPSEIAEFIELHNQYVKADGRMLMLQGAAVEGMRKIGVGCINEQSKAEFQVLKTEIESILKRMKEICSSLD